MQISYSDNATLFHLLPLCLGPCKIKICDSIFSIISPYKLVRTLVSRYYIVTYIQFWLTWILLHVSSDIITLWKHARTKCINRNTHKITQISKFVYVIVILFGFLLLYFSFKSDATLSRFNPTCSLPSLKKTDPPITLLKSISGKVSTKTVIGLWG